MKNYFTFCCLLLATTFGFAQNGINYKALIKNSDGVVIVNQTIDLQFQILEEGTTLSYQESHTTNTDGNGIVIVNIGEGAPQSGTFTEIDWAIADHFLNVKVNTGDGLVDLGTAQFMSVPYANFAEDTRKGTLNDSYNKGGLGEGRIIDAQNGMVEIMGDGLDVESEISVGDKVYQKDNSETAIEFSPNSLTLKTESNSGVYIDDINKEVVINNDEDQVDFIVRSANNDTAIYTDGTTGNVGLGTTTPEGVLDVVTTNDTGLVIPRVSNVQNVTDGNGNPPVNGTLVYDLSKNAICFFLDGKWSCGTTNDLQGGISFNSNGENYTSKQLYFKSSTIGAGDNFGHAVALSGDGNTMAIGAPYSDRMNNSIVEDSGMVVLYRKVNNTWTYLRTHTPACCSFEDFSLANFGYSLSINYDGTRVAVGVKGQSFQSSSSYTDSGGSFSFFNNIPQSGAVWVFYEDVNVYYVTAPNVDEDDGFGHSVSLDHTGNRLVVGAIDEDSNASGVDGDQTNNNASDSGAVYVFDLNGIFYEITAYLKASNTGADDNFGSSVVISGNGEYIAVGATKEDSATIGINGDESNNALSETGAVYMYYNNSGIWEQQAYIKQQNAPGNFNFFGQSVSINNQGTRLAIGAGLKNEVSVLSRNGSVWDYETILNPPIPNHVALFGNSVALSGEGNTLLVGANAEDNNGVGINPPLNNGTISNSGAGFIYSLINNTWSFEAHIKATTTIDIDDFFGYAVAIDNDGSTITLSAINEAGSTPFMGGNQFDNSMPEAGAVYVYEK